MRRQVAPAPDRARPATDRGRALVDPYSARLELPLGFGVRHAARFGDLLDVGLRGGARLAGWRRRARRGPDGGRGGPPRPSPRVRGPRARTPENRTHAGPSL